MYPMDVASPALRLERDEATNELLRVLADGARRRVVAELIRDGPLGVEALARRLAAESDGMSHRTAAIRLVHSHLPQLEAADVVSYDHGERRCELAESEPRSSVEELVEALD